MKFKGTVICVTAAVALLLCAAVSLSLLTQRSLAQVTVISGIADEAQLRAAILSAADGDVIELAADISLSLGGVSIGKELTLRSGGEAQYTITQPSVRIRHFWVESEGRFTLEQVTLEGCGTGGGVQVNRGGRLTMNRGAVIENAYASYGGGAEINAASSLVMNDGAVIANCRTDVYGGGIYIKDALGSAVLHEGAVVRGCTTGYDGGGVYTNGSFTLQGGSIAENQSARGGGISGSSQAHIIVNEGSVAGNVSLETGGGIMLYDRSTATMHGGEVAENRSAQGGGICVSGAEALFTMKGGVIRGNCAEGDDLGREAFGGGLYVAQGAAELYRGAIADNRATQAGHAHGGGVYINSKTRLTLYSAVVAENSSVFQGGGMWVCNTGSGNAKEFRGAAFYRNETQGSGNDIHLNSTQTVFSLSSAALGCGSVDWQRESDGEYLTELAGLTGVLNLTAQLSDSDIAQALQYAAVLVTGNYSEYRGGGLAINGQLSFGSDAPDSLSLEIEKRWAGESPDPRPAAVQVYLVTNGVIQADRAITLREDNGYAAAFEDLPYKDSEGRIIAYAAAEEALPDYSPSYSGLRINDEGNYTLTITNRYDPAHISLPVWKAWADEGDRLGKRPQSVTVQLCANGAAYGEPVVLQAANGWSHVFEDLPKQRSGGAEIVYTLEEAPVQRYEASYLADKETGTVTILNTYVPEKISLTAKKVWEDYDNKQGKRPAGVTVQLLADGAAHGSPVVLDEDNGWEYTWAELLRHGSDGDSEVVYTLSEEEVPGYTVDYAAKEDGFVITNTLITATLTLRKVDADSGEPLSGAAFVLCAADETVLDSQVSGEDGLLRFTGLDSGSYLLREEEAPQGYQRPGGQWLLSIDEDCRVVSIQAAGRAPAIALREEGEVTEYLIPNEKDYILPMTGGAGLWPLLFTGGGCVAAGLSLGLLKQRRKENRSLSYKTT